MVARLKEAVRAYIKVRPAGLTAVLASALVIGAKVIAGVDLTEIEAATIIGVLTGLVSHKSPRA